VMPRLMRPLGLALTAAIAGAQTLPVDFARDVQPILNARCVACHGAEKREAGLDLRSLPAIFKGGQSGAAVVPGASRESHLIQRVTGFKAPVMPFAAEPLGEREIGVLRAWVDSMPASLDAVVDAYFARQGAQVPAVVPDAVFARRVYLDVWGLPPTPEQLDEFLRDRRPDKRERLLDRLLAGEKNYSEHWISWWNDLLRNDEGVAYHGARQSISRWLLGALEKNIAYDRLVQALLDPRGPEDPAGYLMGVNWRGDVSASQIPAMQAAQNSAQVFLGVNLKCNSCHDSFISRWKLADAYGLASLFSDKELEVFRCDAPTGEKAHPKFLFPELGEVAGAASPAERRAAAARLFTAPENTRFARTAVNRIWKKLLGRGLVEPLDEMDNPAWDPALLDWLAGDLVAQQYDLKGLLRRILTSRAYQLPAVPVSAKDVEKKYVFRGPSVRRLTAEQFADAAGAITGEWRVIEPSKPGDSVPSREWRLKSSPLTRALGRPIRDQVYTERSSEATTLQALELVNGNTISRLLDRGARRLLGELKPPPANLYDSGAIRAEKGVVDVDITGARELRLLIEDWDSYDRTRIIAGWVNAELVSPAGVIPLADLPTGSKFERRRLQIRKENPADAVVAAVPSQLLYDVAGKGFTRFRAVVGVDESSLQSDISPRVRFFVFTEEPDRHHLVRLAAAPASKTVDRAALVARLYRHALARDPNAPERSLAQQFLSGGAEGLEDLLWSLFLSPEFQYVQ